MKRLLSVLLLSIFALSLVACDNRTKEEKVTAKLIEIDLTEEEYAFGVDKNQPELLAEVNELIAELEESGKMDELFETYFGDGDPVGVSSSKRDDSKNQLVVATNAAFAPFEYMKGDKFYGIDMEIAKLLAEKLGMELVIEHMDFDAVCLSVGQQQCDIAMAGLTVNKEREEFVTFSDSYYTASQRIITKSTDTTFDECEDAEAVLDILNEMSSDKKIGVQRGTTGQWFVEGDEAWGFEGFDVICNPYNNGALAIQDMLANNIDYVIIDAAPAKTITEAINSSDFEKKVNAFLEIFIEEKGYTLVLKGLKNTLLIAVTGLLVGIIIGMLIATVRVIPKYKVLPRILNHICSFYVAVFRGTPMVVQLLVCYYVLSPLFGWGITGLQSAMIVFGLNSGAYVSEIMRSGIQSVDKGQMEAGRAVGLSFCTTMMKIVIPQAVKNILPTLGNEFIVLVKETSVVSFVTVTDLYLGFQSIGNSTYEYIVPYLAMALVYIVLVLIISLLVKLMERSLNKSDRRN